MFTTKAFTPLFNTDAFDSLMQCNGAVGRNNHLRILETIIFPKSQIHIEYIKNGIAAVRSNHYPHANILYTKEYFIQKDRVEFNLDKNSEIKSLSESQTVALNEINKSFNQNDVTLLHGVTSSGKTEIYVQLIDLAIKQGRQVLYMLPEIALTTQLINLLQ